MDLTEQPETERTSKILCVLNCNEATLKLFSTFVTNTLTESRKYSKCSYDETIQSVVTPYIRHTQIAAFTISVVRLYNLFEIRHKLRDFKRRKAFVSTAQNFISQRYLQQAKYHRVQRLWYTPPYTAPTTTYCTVQVVLSLSFT